MKENVLVTGGAGFIGSHVVEKLIESKKYNVIVIDNLSSGKLENIKNLDIKFIKCDICDNDALEQVFSQEKIDYIIHKAAQVSVSYSMKDSEFDARQNIIGTINLLDKSRKYDIKKFIFASSAAVYGIPEYLPLDEKHKTSPISFYGLSKQSAEEYIKMYNKTYGLNYIIFRYANVYGERQDANGEAGVISIFSDKIQNGEKLAIHGDGEQTRDFIYVKDIAAANLRAVEADCINEVINIGTGESTSINDLYSIFCDIFEKKIEYALGETRDGDIKHSYLKVSKAKELLKWNSVYKIESGLKKYIQSLPINKKDS